MSDSSKAVFISYASQDAEAARRVAEALRAAGVEVWFDQNELVGGDAWDAKIRAQIASCALFVPVISANTQARLEGYFRIEWKLAARRTHAMATAKAFLLPVVIDATRDAEAHVPDEFREVQWIRLRPVVGSGATSPAESEEKALAAFGARVKKLLGGNSGVVTDVRSGGGARIDGAQGKVVAGGRGPAAPLHGRLRGWLVAGAVLAAMGAAWLLWRAPAGETTPAAAPAAEPREAAMSVAVLPFANLSGDPAQEYVSDGLTDEIINALAREPDLRVPGRASSFSFKGKGLPAREIAQALNVSRLVEGSVRRAGSQIRITVSLTRGDDGFSEELGTITEELSDLFALQDKVARLVVVKLTRRSAPASGGVAVTKNAEAYDLFLKANTVFFRGDVGGFEEAIELAGAAARLDPGYTKAAFLMAAAHCNLAGFARQRADVQVLARHAEEARRWTETVVRLDPRAAGPAASAIFHLTVDRDFRRALQQAELSIAARPNDTASQTFRAWALVELGRPAEAVESFRAATTIDPFNPFCLGNEVRAATLLRRSREATAAIQRAEAGAGAKDAEWVDQFMLTGRLPAAADGFSPLQRALWAWRTRRFAELQELASKEFAAAPSPGLRLIWRQWQHDALRRLGWHGDADRTARELIVLAEALEESAAYGPPQKSGRLARALVSAGRGAEGLAAAKAYVDAANPELYPAERWRREIELAEHHAALGQVRECNALLAKLLRLPSGLTVPMLQVDPVWDNVREDAGFKALLADPKNSAPL